MEFWTVPADLPFLDGHFPGQPIVPGVAILNKSVAVIRDKIGADILNLRRVKLAKFLSPLLPGTTVEIRAHVLPDGNWNVEWRLGDVPIVKLVLGF